MLRASGGALRLLQFLVNLLKMQGFLTVRVRCTDLGSSIKDQTSCETVSDSWDLYRNHESSQLRGDHGSTNWFKIAVNFFVVEIQV